MKVLGQFPPDPNSNTNPKPNPNLNRGATFLRGNCPDTSIHTSLTDERLQVYS